MTVDVQPVSAPTALANHVFSIGWRDGMRHVDRLTRRDDWSPVVPDPAGLESGEAA